MFIPPLSFPSEPGLLREWGSLFFSEYTSEGEVNREGKDEERAERAKKTGVNKVQGKQQRDECSQSPARLGKQRELTVQKVVFLLSLALHTHPDWFEEV